MSDDAPESGTDTGDRRAEWIDAAKQSVAWRDLLDPEQSDTGLPSIRLTGKLPGTWFQPAEGLSMTLTSRRGVDDVDGDDPSTLTLATTHDRFSDLSDDLRILEQFAANALDLRDRSLLHLAHLRLEWNDGTNDHSTPVVLQALSIEPHPDGRRKQLVSRARPMLNPALAAEMTALGIEVPPVGTNAINPLDLWLTKTVTANPGWRRRPMSTIGLLDTATAMGTAELLADRGVRRERGVIALLDAVDGEPSSDTREPSSDVVTALPTDTEQRRAVALARAGHSITISGAGGTGRTQTAVAIAADHLARGNRVVLVADRPAAMRALRERFEQIGLGDHVALIDQSTKPVELSKLARQALRHQRRAFDGHDDSSEQQESTGKPAQRLRDDADAMLQLRPIGFDLVTAIDRRAELAGTDAPPATGVDRTLAGAELELILEHAAVLGSMGERSAAVAPDMWTGLAERRVLGDDSSVIIAMTERARLNHERLEDVHLDVARRLNLDWTAGPPDAQRLLGLLRSLKNRARHPREWLAAPTLEPVTAAVAELRSRDTEHQQAITAVHQTVGANWHGIDPFWEIPEAGDVAASPQVNPLSEPDYASLTDRLARGSDAITALAGTGVEFGRRFDLTSGQITVQHLRRGTTIAALVGTADRPPARWLSDDPEELAALERDVTSAIRDLREHGAAATQRFNTRALDADLERINTELGPPGSRNKRKVNATLRSVLADIAADGTVDNELLEAVPVARKWQQAVVELEAVELRSAHLLDTPLFQGVDTDLDAFSAAITRANELRNLADDDISIATIGALLTTEPDRAWDRQVKQVGDALGELDELDTAELQRLGAPLGEPISTLKQWWDTSSPQLESSQDVRRHVAEAMGRDVSPAETAQAIEAVRLVHRTHDALASTQEEAERLLGPSLPRTARAWDELDAGVASANAVRRAYGGPIPEATVDTLLSTAPEPGRLAEALSHWHRTSAWIRAAFIGGQQRNIIEALDGDHETARRTLDGLIEHRAELDDAIAVRAAEADLDRRGLGPAVDWCRQRDLTGTRFVDAIERSVLDQWIDDVGGLTAPGSSSPTDDPSGRATRVDAEAFSSLRRSAIETARIAAIEGAEQLRLEPFDIPAGSGGNRGLASVMPVAAAAFPVLITGLEGASILGTADLRPDLVIADLVDAPGAVLLAPTAALAEQLVIASPLAEPNGLPHVQLRTSHRAAHPGMATRDQDGRLLRSIPVPEGTPPIEIVALEGGSRDDVLSDLVATQFREAEGPLTVAIVTPDSATTASVQQTLRHHVRGWVAGTPTELAGATFDTVIVCPVDDEHAAEIDGFAAGLTTGALIVVVEDEPSRQVRLARARRATPGWEAGEPGDSSALLADMAARLERRLAMPATSSSQDEHDGQTTATTTVTVTGHDQLGCDLVIERTGEVPVAVRVSPAIGADDGSDLEDRELHVPTALESRGWITHRIDLADWLRDEDGEVAQLTRAMNGGAPTTADRTQRERYMPADVDRPDEELPLTGDAGRTAIRDIVTAIVRAETPVHRARVIRRTVLARGHLPSNALAVGAVRTVLGELVGTVFEQDEAGFVRPVDRSPDRVRVPTDDPDTQRPIPEVPSTELAKALLLLLRDDALTPRQLLRAVAVMYRWDVSSADLSVTTARILHLLQQDGYIAVQGGVLVPTRGPGSDRSLSMPPVLVPRTSDDRETA